MKRSVNSVSERLAVTPGISRATWYSFLPDFSRRKKNLKREFERIALPHLSDLYTAGYYLTKDKREAEDLVQETYLRAFRFFEKFEPGTNCKGWLLTILRRLFINRHRKETREPEMVDWKKIDQSFVQEEETAQTNPEHQFFWKLLDREIEEALKALPEEFRMAVILLDVEELSYEEAARVMECPIGTVRSRVSRGRRMLRVALADYAVKRGLILSLTSS